MSLSCIVQTLWQCQVIIEATVPIFVIKMEADMQQKNHLLVMKGDVGMAKCFSKKY